MLSRYCSQTHYETLGIERSASQAEVRSAFLSLSKKVKLVNLYTCNHISLLYNNMFKLRYIYMYINIYKLYMCMHHNLFSYTNLKLCFEEKLKKNVGACMPFWSSTVHVCVQFRHMHLAPYKLKFSAQDITIFTFVMMCYCKMKSSQTRSLHWNRKSDQQQGQLLPTIQRGPGSGHGAAEDFTFTTWATCVSKFCVGNCQCASVVHHM